MRGVVAVAAALLVALGSSGCFVSDDDPQTQGEEDGTSNGSGSGSPKSGSSTKSGSGGASGSGAGNGTGSPAGNHAPKASLTANVTTGAAGLSVNFTLNATDADGDALSWVLSFGDDSVNETGTGLPASKVHAFAAAGNYTARLNVTDGNLSANGTVVITVTAGVAIGGGEPVVFTGESAVPNPSGECIGYFFGNGLDGSNHVFPHSLDGWSWTLTPGFYVAFWKGVDFTGDGEGSGTVPAGSDNVDICTSDPTMAGESYTMTITPP